MKERELEAKVLWFVREIGIATGDKVRSVSFDLTRGVVVIETLGATYATPAAGLWSDYADNAARTRPRHAQLIRYPKERSGSSGHTGVPHAD